MNFSTNTVVWSRLWITLIHPLLDCHPTHTTRLSTQPLTHTHLQDRLVCSLAPGPVDDRHIQAQPLHHVNPQVAELAIAEGHDLVACCVVFGSVQCGVIRLVGRQAWDRVVGVSTVTIAQHMRLREGPAQYPVGALSYWGD